MFTARLPIIIRNSFFFEFWDQSFVKTFGLLCPFYEFSSVKDLEDLLDAKVHRYSMLIVQLMM